ncbi:MAG: DNA translocase FtsK 4TM domain-containing protein [Candidatus Kapaibacteriales bacterium]
MSREVEIKYLKKTTPLDSFKNIHSNDDEIPSELKRKYIRNIRIFSVSLFLFALLSFFAIISHSPRDEFILDFGLKDFYGAIKNDPELLKKVKEVNNIFGPIGAIVSNFFVNKTIGYFSLLICVVFMLISGKLYVTQKITSSVIHTSITLILFGVLFASFLGSLNASFHLSIPISFIGLVGFVISKIFANLLGNIGSVVILFLLLFVLISFSFNLEYDKILRIIWKFLKERLIPFVKSILFFDSNPKVIEEVQSERNSKENNRNFESLETEEFDSDTVESLRINFNPISLSDYEDETLLNDVTDQNNSQQIERGNKLIDEDIIYQTENINPLGDIKSVQSEIKTPSSEGTDDLKKLVLEVEEVLPQGNVENNSNTRFNPISTSLLDEKVSYEPPPIDLFIDDESKFQINEEELKANAKLLQEKLETFKIYIQNLKVVPGPVVTQYEFVPAPGIKISRIQSLADDIALALKARGIRIIAPVPGKGTVGIEIPNRKPLVVRFGNCLKNAKLNPNFKLPIIMGKTISGEVFIDDLARMPHLLIAGATGSGKSVGINTIITSLVYFLHPQSLKLVIIDPKKVELSHYQSLLYHYLAVSPEIEDAIVTDPTNAVLVLKALVAEMQFRYDILASVQQRNISEYNKKVKAGYFKDNNEFIHKPMPYVVVIIDELADLMLTTGKEIESLIIRLAQLARAVGIHLVVATQRPSVDIITGLIKANFPARIAYLVASRVDSRTIIDNIGAERLIGNGDMLFLPNGSTTPIRIQNAFLTTDEIENLCNHIASQKGYSKPYYLPFVNDSKSNKEGIARGGLDELFEEAARLVVRSQQASVSMLQRRLKVGYNRAGRIMDELEALGIVGPFDGSKGRVVRLTSEEELNRFLRENL